MADADESYAAIAARWADVHSEETDLCRKYSRWYVVPGSTSRVQVTVYGFGRAGTVNIKVIRRVVEEVSTSGYRSTTESWLEAGHGYETTPEIAAMLVARRAFDDWASGGPVPPPSTSSSPWPPVRRTVTS